MLRQGNKPTIHFIKEVLIKNASDEEQSAIREHLDAGCDLTNSTNGGSGSHGRVMSEETKKKISDAHKKRKPSDSQLKILRTNAEKMKGAKRDKSVCESISAGLVGKKKTKEHCEAMSKVRLGIVNELSEEATLSKKSKLSKFAACRSRDEKGSFVNTDKTVRCVVCDSEFSDDEIKSSSCCPCCGATSLPMLITQDTTIKINWHCLRILTIWASNWAAEKCDESARNAVSSIIKRLEPQRKEDWPALTLLGEIKELPETLRKMGIECGHVEMYDNKQERIHPPKPKVIL